MTTAIEIDARRTYTVAAYAEVAGCSIYTASRRCKAGLIPGASKPHGGQWRIPGNALLAFVVQDTSTTAKPVAVKVPGIKASQRAKANEKLVHSHNHRQP